VRSVIIRHTFILIILTSFGCKNKIALDDDATPTTLLIGVFGGEGPDETRDRLGPIGKYLEKKLGMPVEFIMTTDYAAVIEAIHAKKVHVADLAPFSYVLATKKGDVDLLVTFGVNGKPYQYRSAIITGRNSGLKNMEDVKARSKDLTLCFPDPSSASGHLIPLAYLKSIGLDPDNDFKETLFASGHIASIMTVKSGKMDLGCTAYMALDILLNRKMLKEGDIRTLWLSEPIVSNAIVVRKDINKEFANKIRQAYLDLPEDGRDAWNYYLTKIYGNSKNDSLRYIVADDSIYNGIRKIVNGLDNDKIFQ